MARTIPTRGLKFLLCGVALACLGGCSKHKEQDYLPATDRARESLEQVLTAWQNGLPPHIDGSPSIEAVDARWKNGAKLARYEILGSETTNDRRTWFKVKLTLKEPAAEKTVRYVVVGIDPLWVYSEEEYNPGISM